MTHHQLVEEWKKQLRLEASREGFNSVFDQANEFFFKNFLTRAMLAAAKGAAEAGKVEKYKREKTDHVNEVWFYDGRDGAISQSERQLEDYFNGI